MDLSQKSTILKNDISRYSVLSYSLLSDRLVPSMPCIQEIIWLYSKSHVAVTLNVCGRTNKYVLLTQISLSSNISPRRQVTAHDGCAQQAVAVIPPAGCHHQPPSTCCTSAITQRMFVLVQTRFLTLYPKLKGPIRNEHA